MYFLFLAPLMQCTNFLYLTENVRLIKAAKLNCKKKKEKKNIAAGMTGTNTKSASIEFNVIALKNMFAAWNRKINNTFVAR